MDPERETLERRIADVKRSLAARLDALGGRMNRARRMLAVRQNLREHLGAAMGVAATIGFLLGRRAVKHRPLLPGEIHIPPPAPQKSLTASVVESIIRSIAATIAAAAATGVMKEMAEHEAKEAVREGEVFAPTDEALTDETLIVDPGRPIA